MTMSLIKRMVLTILLTTTLLVSGCGYNSLQAKDEAVNAAWSEVENQYQRRADLVPNLVNVVKGYAKHEKDVLVQVTQARASVASLKIDAQTLQDPAAFQKFQQAQAQLGSALSRLIAVSENYPDLKANQNFLELQAQLEGTENRIAVERGRFNELAKEYNAYIRKFPRNMFAGMFGFEKRPYFEAEAGSEKAPAVEF